MPSDQLLDFLEIVVRAGLVAVAAITVAFSFGVAVTLLITRPKRTAEAPATAPAARPAVVPADTRSNLRPSAA